MSQENSYDVLHSIPEIKRKDELDREENISIVVTPDDLPMATKERAEKTTAELKKAKESKPRIQTGVEVGTIDVDTQFLNNGPEINTNEKEKETGIEK